MKLINCEGIILNKVNFGEADVYISVFSNIYGKITFPIKGIRKSKTREQSAIDTGSFSKFILYKKEDHLTLSKIECGNSFPKIKSNLDKISIFLYIIGILNSILQEGVRKREMYKLTLNTFNYLEKEENINLSYLCLAYYMFSTIKEEGILFSDLKEFSFHKLNSFQKEIVENFLIGNTKSNIELAPSKEDCINIILSFEKYINYHSELNLSFNKYYLG